MRRVSTRPRVPVLFWDQVVDAPHLGDAVAVIAKAYNFRRHPYFLWAHAEATSKVSFRCSQVRFRYAVEGWSQSLSAVVARIPRLEDRAEIVRNVLDEHGGDSDGSHKASFHRFLVALGTTPRELATPCPIQVRAFQQALTNFCMVQPYEAGGAALGIIEQLYIDISTMIAQLVVERGWASAADQDHYRVHEELDVKHAHDLLELAAAGWEEKRMRALIALGLQLGAHHFWQLYSDVMPVDT